jgi:tyrosyl-tRNA synthetase
VVHALTFPLITTSSGIKMGKTHQGAVWLDPELTPAYDYYQYWINQDDRDVERFLGLFTFLPMAEVRRLGALKGEGIREAKEVLAYEATALCHGEGEAEKARSAARELFGGGGSESSESVPSCLVGAPELEQGLAAYVLFEKCGLCKTRGEARRLLSQGGGYFNGRRIEAFDQVLSSRDLANGSILLRAGKKKYVRVTPS